MTIIKTVGGVSLDKLEENRFVIRRLDPMFVYSGNYLGHGNWGNSFPMAFFSEEKALIAFNKAVATHFAEQFIAYDIVFCREVVTNNTVRYYGVTFNKDVGTFAAGSKCNHIRRTKGSAVIKVCDEDDTVIENLVFGRPKND